MPLRWAQCRDTKFNKDWYRRSNVNRVGRYTDTHGQQRDLITLLNLSQNKESRLKKGTNK
jgi:hypothetical protein